MRLAKSQQSTEQPESQQSEIAQRIKKGRVKVGLPPEPAPEPEATKPIEQPGPPITPQSIKDLRLSIRSWLIFPSVDMDIIDFVLAVYFSERMDGDPLWGMIIDASGGGKTELLRTLRDEPYAYFMSKMTDKSMFSMFRDSKHPEDLSIIKDLDGKVFIVKDMAPLLETKADKRKAVFSDLRDTYDGFSDRASGMTGRMSYTAHFSFLAGCTKAIDQYTSMETELGERYLKIRARGDDAQTTIHSADGKVTHRPVRLLKAERAGRTAGQEKEMREDLKRKVHDFLNLTIPIPRHVPQSIERQLAALADFTARARSSVARERGGPVLYKPQAEYGTRLNKELTKLLLALAAIRGHSEPDNEDFATVQRVAEDSLPPNRLLVLNYLRSKESAGCGNVAEIAEAVDLSENTTRLLLEDLRLLKIVNRDGAKGEKILYRLD